MASALRRILAERLAIPLRNHTKSSDVFSSNDVISKLAWCVRLRSVNKKTDPQRSQIYVPFKYLEASGFLAVNKWQAQKDEVTSIFAQAHCDDVLTQVAVENNAVVLSVNPSTICKQTLNAIASNSAKFGGESIVHKYKLSDGKLHQCQHETVVVEFSSPNIAKLFHAGHLRSTVIGNFVANIHDILGHKVVRLNYLGDWGTQFGLLGVGYRRYGDEEALARDPMRHLFEVYVRANRDVEPGSPLREQMKKDSWEFFAQMESGDQEALDILQRFWTYSIENYKKLYQRLGVRFDEYHSESMYHEKNKEVVAALAEKGLLSVTPDGVSYVDLGSDDTPNLHANILKSDGTSLYITRDIAALIDRQVKYHFNRIYYVVENAQHLHFLQLREVIRKMGFPWASAVDNLHVKFGRIRGMSTRKGQVVFLKDILDAVRDKMVESIRNTPTTKVTENIEKVADELGISAIIIQDLKEHRKNNYNFDWNRIFNFNGDTGLYLQYTHARLCSLEKNCGVPLNLNADLDSLVDDCAIRIALHLARYDEVLQEAYMTLEPCHVTSYLFKLARLLSVAHEELQVKGAEPSVAEARLLLFNAGRQVLASGLQVLGVLPLEKI